MPRYDEWIGGERRPGARLVRMQDGQNKQSINICWSSNIMGEYERIFDIESPHPFLTEREFRSCKSLGELIEKVVRRHGVERGKPSPSRDSQA